MQLTHQKKKKIHNQFQRKKLSYLLIGRKEQVKSTP
jgi:hypothetical protein